jgi:hypothetical protein
MYCKLFDVFWAPVRYGTKILGTLKGLLAAL